jgi:hypothetical protein
MFDDAKPTDDEQPDGPSRLEIFDGELQDGLTREVRPNGFRVGLIFIAYI